MLSATTAARHRNHRHGLLVADKAVAAALVSLVLVYSLITVVTYHLVATSDVASRIRGVGDTTRSTTTTRTGRAIETLHELQHTFPVHVNEAAREVIEHPGAIYINKDAFPSNLDEHALVVPMFFDTAYGHVYGRERVRDYLGERGARLITSDEAASIGSYDSNERETIFASIASYRDPECAGTVSDLYERAEYPERIRVAIVEQRLSEDTICTTPEKDCASDPSQALCKYAHLIDYFQLDAHFAVGPVFARHLAHRHYRGEYYAMQIDSHVRMTEHWDTDIVGQWKSARNEMAVLTSYPSDISGSIDPVTHRSLHPGMSAIGRACWIQQKAANIGF